MFTKKLEAKKGKGGGDRAKSANTFFNDDMDKIVTM
jgi:hypothetical protein